MLRNASGIVAVAAVCFTIDGSRRAAASAGRPAAPRRGAGRIHPSPRPAAGRDEGKGPFKTLVIRGAMLIDGTGAPPRGPVDIVVEGNRIAAVRSAGTPGPAAAREPRSRRRSTKWTRPACT